MDKKSNSGVAALPTSRTRDSTLLVPIETAAILINPAEALTVLFYDQYASSRLISEIVSIATRMFLASRYPPVAIYICHGHRCSVIKLIFILRGVPYKASLGPSQSETPCKSDETFDENLAGGNRHSGQPLLFWRNTDSICNQ